MTINYQEPGGRQIAIQPPSVQSRSWVGEHGILHDTNPVPGSSRNPSLVWGRARSQGVPRLPHIIRSFKNGLKRRLEPKIV